MRSVLITGAGGLIGSRVAEAARKAGYEVTRIFHRAPVPKAADLLSRDLRLPLEDVPRVGSIFHLAGGYAGAERRILERTDLLIARNVIRWGVDHGVRNWVFASAAEVYGHVNGLATEQTPTNPVIPYGHIKLAVERLFVSMANGQSDFRIVILRIGEVYSGESRLLRELTERLKRGFCPCPRSGRIAVSFVHVEDVAQAFLLAAECAPNPVSIYNVADDEPTTWRSFVDYLAELLGTRRPVFLPYPLVCAYMLGHQLRSRIANEEPVLTVHALQLLTTPKALSNRRIKKDLGFIPRYPNFRHGLEATLHGLSYDAQNGAAERSSPH
jgi:nucleoside-diphosphate-sugar epimerase